MIFNLFSETTYWGQMYANQVGALVSIAGDLGIVLPFDKTDGIEGMKRTRIRPKFMRSCVEIIIPERS